MSNNENVIDFELTQDYIELIKLLKLLNLVESGADAKIAVEDGEVECNGLVEFRKRKKLRQGDIVSFSENTIKII
jgi:ribosome-associated protein